MTFTHPDRPILAVNFYLDHGQHFRLAAEAMVLTEANLSIGNLDFNDYASGAEMEADNIARRKGRGRVRTRRGVPDPVSKQRASSDLGRLSPSTQRRIRPNKTATGERRAAAAQPAQ